VNPCEEGITGSCEDPCFDNGEKCVINCGIGLTGQDGKCVDVCVLKSPNTYTGLCEGTCVANIIKYEYLFIYWMFIYNFQMPTEV
jgi:hypothetical protein